MSKAAELKASNPEAFARPEVQGVLADLAGYAALAAFDASEAGQKLREALISDLGAAVMALVASYRTEPHVELLALCARMEARLALLTALGRGKKNQELAEAALKDLTS